MYCFNLEFQVLKYLSPEGIVFSQRPVNGIKLYSSIPEKKATLKWRPILADVSTSGDIGYSSGPYVYIKSNADTLYGHYISIWKKQENGTWKLAVDAGFWHEKVLYLDSKFENIKPNFEKSVVSQKIPDQQKIKTEFLETINNFYSVSKNKGFLKHC